MKEDVDRKRAMKLTLVDATQRILSPEEVRSIHSAVLQSDMSSDEKGVGLTIVQRINNGVVLTWPEANALAQSIDKIWLEKPAKIIGEGSHVDGVDVCRLCDCDTTKSCPECSSCPFMVEQIGGTIRNSLHRPRVLVGNPNQ